MRKMKKMSVICGLVLAMALASGCKKPAAETETVAATETWKVIEPETGKVTDEAKPPAASETETETESEPEDDGTADTFLLYLSGIDVWGATENTSRSDVNILMAVNRKTHKVQLVNTPRDYYVTLPISGGSRDKLTHAGIYGVEVSEGALENLYGVDIDYYLRLNFSGFEAIIDAVGGIDVYSEYDFTVEPIKHYTEGMNHLTGLESLAFVRERKSFNAGDVQRGKNQMEMVKALVDKFTSEDILKTYDTWMDEDLQLLYQTNMPKELLASLIMHQLAEKPDWDIETYYVTGSGGSEYTYSIPGSRAYVMIPNDDEVAEGGKLLRETLEGTAADAETETEETAQE